MYDFVDAEVLAEAEINVLHSRHNFFEVGDGLLHALTRRKMLSLAQAKSIMNLRSYGERNNSLVEKLSSNESYSLCQLQFVLPSETTRKRLQWLILGEAGAFEIEEQVQKEGTNPTRPSLHSRHFSPSERSQIVDMLILRSTMAHDAAKSHLKQLDTTSTQLKEKRRLLERRVQLMVNSLEISLRQNSYLLEDDVGGNELEVSSSSSFSTMVPSSGRKLMENLEKKVDFLMSFCLRSLQEKERTWKRLEKLRKKLLLRSDNKSRSFADGLSKPEIFLEHSRPETVGGSVDAAENESYQQKLTALGEELTRQENAIFKMRLEIRNNADILHRSSFNYQTSAEGRFPPVDLSKYMYIN